MQERERWILARRAYEYGKQLSTLAIRNNARVIQASSSLVAETRRVQFHERTPSTGTPGSSRDRGELPCAGPSAVGRRWRSAGASLLRCRHHQWSPITGVDTLSYITKPTRASHSASAPSTLTTPIALPSRSKARTSTLIGARNHSRWLALSSNVRRHRRRRR